MNEPLTLVLACLAGALLGAMFFGGLWWTVRRGVASPHAALWFMVSLLARMSVLLAGFYFVGRGHWERMLACIVGFLVARFLVTWLLLPASLEAPRAPEAGHAP
jgi:F1F0 ATPase subunit 2